MQTDKNMENRDENLTINVFLKNKGNLLANATISINTIELGFITIKDFQIWDSRNFNENLQAAINITAPSIPFKGKYHPRVFIEDKEKWRNLESKIYEAYLGLPKKENREEEIDLEEIPV